MWPVSHWHVNSPTPTLNGSTDSIVMRLTLRLSPNTEPVLFDHLDCLRGALHKWLGENNTEHDGLSLYSFSWLRGARSRRDRLDFPGGADWTVSFLDTMAAKRLLNGILSDPVVAFGMRAYEAREQATPRFTTTERFLVDGAVLTRRNRDDGGRDHLTFEDPEADATLTRTLRRKLEAAGLDGPHLDTTARFDRSFKRARTKMVTINGIKHRTSECPVIIDGTQDAVCAAWLMGVGELTGSGLGALR